MNKRRMLIVILFISLGLFMYSSTVAAETNFKAVMLANPCAGCHGTDARSTGEIPSLYNLKSDYIESAMLAFKSDKRPGTVMNRIAKGYTDSEIKIMASHFASANKSKKK